MVIWISSFGCSGPVASHFCGVVSMGIDVASLLLNYSRFNMISSLKSQQTLPRRLASMKFRNESPRIWLLGLFLTCCGYTWSSFFTFLVQLLTGCVHNFFFVDVKCCCFVYHFMFGKETKRLWIILVSWCDPGSLCLWICIPFETGVLYIFVNCSVVNFVYEM